MKDLADNLIKAQAGDTDAAEYCCRLFNAMTNDKSMQKILRGSSEHFESCKVVIKVCFELAQTAQLRAIRCEAKPENDSMEKLEGLTQCFLESFIK